MIDFDQFVDRLVQTGIASRNQVVGCSEEEIKSLEVVRGIKLPELYRDFLRRMGHSAGDFLKGTDAFFQHLPLLTDWANELLQRDHQPPLGTTVFVFGMHQGYQFVFFDSDKGEDPPVGGYLEKSGFYKVSETLSGYLNKLLQDFGKERTQLRRQGL